MASHVYLCPEGARHIEEDRGSQAGAWHSLTLCTLFLLKFVNLFVLLHDGDKLFSVFPF